jgi:hypothetical protein
LFALRASSSARFAAVLALVVGAVGCAPATDPPLPPPPRSDGGPDASLRSLAVIPDATPRTLLLGESLSFAVRYTESDGRPVTDAEVTFAMVGVAHDASLAESVAVTDIDGIARGTLRAGRTRAAFRVRASAMGAAPASFDVAIGDAGFGALRAEVRYEGDRPLAARSIALYAEVTCGDALAGIEPDREQALVELGDAVRFVALPAGLAYAVVARGTTLSGAVLAQGCAEAPAVTSGGEASAVVTMRDVPPRIEGAYDVALDVRAPGAALALGEATTALVAASEATGGDAALLLDAIALDLADRDADAATRFALARDAQRLDAALAGALVASGASPTGGMIALAGSAVDALESLRVSGALGLDARGRVTPEGVTDVSVFAAAARPEGALPLALASAPRVGFASGYAPIRGILVVEELRVALPLGAVLRATLEAVAQARGAGGADAFVAEQAGCEAFAAWAAATPAIAEACDAACARAACVGAARARTATLGASLDALDTARTTIQLVGALPVADADFDARVEAFGPEPLAGSWRDAAGTSGDPVSATLAARRR